jgi:hypothetical protein
VLLREEQPSLVFHDLFGVRVCLFGLRGNGRALEHLHADCDELVQNV